MRITEATQDDRAATVGLWHAAGLTRPWNDPEADFDLAIATPTSTIFLARINESLAGSVMAGFDGHRGWVYYLASDPSHRRKGVGRELMAAAENWLTEKGCKRLRLMVRHDNISATDFYEAIGYEHQDVAVLGRTLG